MTRKLTNKQERFCQEYVADYNGAAAVIRAGYSRNGANVAASYLLSQPEIAARIKELQLPRTKEITATQERIIQELSRIAFADVRELYDEKGHLKPIHELEAHVAATISEVTEEWRTDGSGEDKETVHTKKIKRNEKLRALELLMKQMQMFNETLHLTGEVTVKTPDLATLSDEERLALRRFIEIRANSSESPPEGTGQG